MNKELLDHCRSYYDTYGNMPSSMVLDLFEAAAKGLEDEVETEAPAEVIKPTKKAIKPIRADA